MTKSTWSEKEQRLIPNGPAKTPHDALPLPSGKTVGALSSAALASTLAALGVPGVSPAHGRERNAEAYAAFLGKLKADAAADAVARWLASKPV